MFRIIGVPEQWGKRERPLLLLPYATLVTTLLEHDPPLLNLRAAKDVLDGDMSNAISKLVEANVLLIRPFSEWASDQE